MEIKPHSFKTNKNTLFRNNSSSNLTFDLKSNKLANPDWEASRVSEGVNIRDLMMEERRIRSMIREGRKKRKNEIDNIHLSMLRDKYEASTNLYITETKTGKGEKEDEFEDERIINKFELLNKEKPLLPLLREKSSKINKFKGKSFSGNIVNFNSKDNINLSQGKLSEFMDRTRRINFLKYFLVIKNESHFKQNEDYKNEIDVFKDNIISMEKTLKKETEFIQTYNSYIKYIMIEKKKESLLLYDLERRKQKLEGEIKRIDNSIQKLNEKRAENKVFRNFIICVKERRFPNDLVEWCRKYILAKFVNKNIGFNAATKQKKKKSLSLNKINNLDNVLRLDCQNLSSINDKEIVDYYFSDAYSDNLKIFNNSMEIYDEIKLLEHKNLLLIEEFNKNEVTMSEMNKNLEDMSAEIKRLGSKDNKIVTKNENLLADLVFKAKKLKEERIILDKSDKNVGKDTSNHKGMKNYSFKFYSKICETFKICITANISKIEEILIKFNSLRKLRGNNTTYYLERAQSSSKILSKEDYMEMLTLCEKIILFLKNSYTSYYSLNRQELKMIEMSLEHDRVKKKADDKKKELLKNNIQLREKITQKMNKIYILPKRKVTGRFKFFEKKNKNFEKINTSENLNVHEFLYYEDN